MQRRAFLVTAGAVAVYPVRSAECGMRSGVSPAQLRTPHSALHTGSAQEPSLSPEVFARRLERARGELKARGLDLLIATPSTNYEYLTGYNPGRSERLIALFLPLKGDPIIVCPAFEVERLKLHSVRADLRAWEEQKDPYDVVHQIGRELKPLHRRGQVGLEPTTAYQTLLRLDDKMDNWEFH